MTAILNKKVLLSIGAIVAVAAVALSATYAAFTATASIEENTLGTATVSITAESIANSSSVVSPVFAENVLPGYVAPEEDGEFRTIVTNDSSVPLDIYMYVSSKTNTGSGNTCAKTKIAYQASLPNSLTIYSGYYPYSDLVNPESPDFFFLSEIDTAGEKVLLAENVAPNGGEVAVRTVPAFASDANNNHQGGCEWTQTYYGETITPTP